MIADVKTYSSIMLENRNCILKNSDVYSYFQLKYFYFCNIFQCKDCENSKDVENFLEQEDSAVY